MTTKSIVTVEYTKLDSNLVAQLNKLKRDLEAAGLTVQLDFGDRKYNALENSETAKKFRQQIVLERADLIATIEYDQVMNNADRHRREELGWFDDEDYEEESHDAYNPLLAMDKLIAAITAYLGEEQYP